MKKLPIGIQTFSELVDPGESYVYVDKTAVLHTLVTEGEYYFLSRPPCFGKSVMLSTLYELFSGNKKLFKGLYIEDKWDWNKQYPVIRISFGGGDFSSEEKFNSRLLRIMADNAKRLGVDLETTVSDPITCFRSLIKKLASQYSQKIVILIDEYDKPVLNHITNKEKARENSNKLNGFCSIIKDLDEHIKFVMITGVSRIANMNLFSGLNNLNDISIGSKYATICGYTHCEVENTFAAHLQGVDMAKLQEWYNGYNYFGESVYNPFDILLFLAHGKEYRLYRWSTGTPGFLIDLLKEQRCYLPDLENFIADDVILDSFAYDRGRTADVDHIDLVALLWQTGYLTFAGKEQSIDGIEYKMKIPNKETQLSLNELFIICLTGHRHERLTWQDNLYDSLVDGDLEPFIQTLKSLFTSISHHNYTQDIVQKHEGYYASVTYAYLASLGLQLIAEDTTDKDRLGMTIILPDKVYVIEFKVNKTDEALTQIKEKGYHEKYIADGKAIYIVGINFDSEEKNITEFDWELCEKEAL